MTRVKITRPAWMGGFLIFWRITLLISLGFGALVAAQSDPSMLHSWRAGALALLVAGFLACYELFERSEVRRGWDWPMPYHLVLLYLIVQAVLVVGLLHFSFAFVGPVFALMGQVFSSLPMRQWVIPIGCIIALSSVPLGLADAIRDSSWLALAGFAFFMIGWVGVAIFIGMLFHEHHERECLIAELRQAKDELERYATQAEELAALRERARLAREMHDSLGHALVVVNVKLEAAQRLYAMDARRGADELEATRALVRETMGELRRSLGDLRAALPDRRSLPEALQRVADEVRARANLEIACTAPRDLPDMAPQTAEALWRVAREALTNVERHAAAASASVTIERANGSLILRVIDDGSGITASDLARPGHYGVTGMRERVEALGGSLKIAPRAGGGTLVEARVPVDLPHSGNNAELLEHR